MSAMKIGTGHRGRARWRRDGSLWTIYGGMDHRVHLDHRQPDGRLVQGYLFDATMSGIAGATLSELSGPDCWEDAAGVFWVCWRVEAAGKGYGQLWSDRDGFVYEGKVRPVWSSNPWAFGDDWIGWQQAADHMVYASPLTDLSYIERLGPGDPMGLSRLTAQPSGIPAFLVYPSESYSFPDGPWTVRHMGGGHGALTTHTGEPESRTSFDGQDANQPWIADWQGDRAALITHGSGDGVRIDCFTRADLAGTPIEPPIPPEPVPPEPVPVPPAARLLGARLKVPMFGIQYVPHDVIDRFEKRYAGQPSSNLALMQSEFIAYITSRPEYPVPPGDWTELEKIANTHIDQVFKDGVPNP